MTPNIGDRIGEVIPKELLQRKQECLDNLDTHYLVIRELEDVLREIEQILMETYL